MSFSQLPAVKKNTENGAAVTSLRTFVSSNDFSAQSNGVHEKACVLKSHFFELLCSIY